CRSRPASSIRAFGVPSPSNPLSSWEDRPGPPDGCAVDQNPKPKCIANVTGFALGPPGGRLNRTGRSASMKYALKKPDSALIGQLLLSSGVNPNCEEFTSKASRIPAPKPWPNAHTRPGWRVRLTFRGES